MNTLIENAVEKDAYLNMKNPERDEQVRQRLEAAFILGKEILTKAVKPFHLEGDHISDGEGNLIVTIRCDSLTSDFDSQREARYGVALYIVELLNAHTI